MKLEIINCFHDTECVVSVKSSFVRSTPEYTLEALGYEVMNRDDDARYARRKLKEIHDKTCGASDCGCQGHEQVYFVE